MKFHSMNQRDSKKTFYLSPLAYSLCSYRYRCDHPVSDLRKYQWISYGKDGCGYHYILWLLYSGNFIQQNKTKGRSVNDSKDLCIYVDDCNGTAAFILKAVIYNGVPIIYKRVKINTIKENVSLKLHKNKGKSFLNSKSMVNIHKL